MARNGKVATIFGGSGFIGRHIVQRLARAGWTVRVAVRHPDTAAFLKPMGDVGQIVPVRCDVTRDADVAAVLAGADAAVNLVGILYERGRRSFQAMHVDAAARIAKAATAAGVTTLVQMSALGASTQSTSVYAQTKARGEDAVREAFPSAVVLRPSVVFGPQDGFFNMFGALARFSPALPLVGGGNTRFQPVYVCDVADAAMAALSDPAHVGKTFELGGPRVYTFKQLLQILLQEIDRKRLLIPVPFPLATIKAAVLELLPKPLLTRDQVELLKTDNICSGTLPGLEAFAIEPAAVEVVLPSYVDIYRKGGRFTAAASH